MNLLTYLNHQSWKKILSQEIELDYYKNLSQFLNFEFENYLIFPSKKNIFTALNLTCFSEIKVVIIGQDPYHNHNQAHGLSFSVTNGTKIPPSLNNIFKEMSSDLNTGFPKCGDLSYLAKQGVLLLNSILTVRAHQAGSHKNKGWEELTDNLIRHISTNKKDVIFILWGSFAQKKEELIEKQKHHILKAAHPSPLSAYKGFFGCKHFSKCNQLLRASNKKEIKWVKS
ncbi:MAG: uracil-DNA glycosylase [Flavobacteriales bacterium]